MGRPRFFDPSFKFWLGNSANHDGHKAVRNELYEIFNKNSEDFSGNFCIDDLVLHDAGVKDFSHYADVPFDQLALDFFLPDETPLPDEIKNS